MNTNLSTMNCLRQLSADDLDSISGGNPVIVTGPVRLVQALFGGKSFVATVVEKALKDAQRPTQK